MSPEAKAFIKKRLLKSPTLEPHQLALPLSNSNQSSAKKGGNRSLGHSLGNMSRESKDGSLADTKLTASTAGGGNGGPASIRKAPKMNMKDKLQ